MRIVRWGEAGAESFGLLANDMVHDLSGVDGLKDAVPFSKDWFGAIGSVNPGELPKVPAGTRLGPCVPQPPKFIAIGLNYKDHAAETGMELPEEPIIFMKAPNCIAGPSDIVTIPEAVDELDWEVELGIVIGAPGYRIPKEQALEHVAGYCVVNDLSARDWQFKGTGQWVKGKSFPGAGPVGPWLVTPDEIGDLNSLSLTLSVDDETRQEGTTGTMIFDVPTLISKVSTFMALEAGDIIATGTPSGVGFGRNPKVFLEAGQTVTSEITGLGKQEISLAR
ncbi:MAG: fumarylacetoacetate hydrolase family protein [Pseudomonadota bacterium]